MIPLPGRHGSCSFSRQMLPPPPTSTQAIGGAGRSSPITTRTPSAGCPPGDGRSVRGRRGVGGSRSQLASGQGGGRSTTRRGRGGGGGVLGVRRDGAVPAVQRGRVRVQAAAGGGGQQGPEGGQEHGHQIHFRAAHQVDLLQPLLLHSLLHYLRRLRRNP